MAFQPLSVGDILMLSQCAWRIGRAFVQKSAPTGFARVEHEANGLSNALKLAAEALHADDSILTRADEETVQAVWAILESAQKSLSDLESFVERYQVIKKRDVKGGYTIDRSWSEAVVANYKTIKWTTEGGTIKQLQDVLQMHTNTISLTMQALQTKSLDRLERTVMPMAENVASIHERVHGDLGNKVDEVHRVIMAIANSTPSLQARDRIIEFSDHRRQPSGGTASKASFSLDSPMIEDSPHTRPGSEIVDSRCDSAIVAPLNIPRREKKPRLLLPSPHLEARSDGVGESWLIDLGDEDDVAAAPTRDGAESRASISVYADSRPQSLAESPTSARRESLVTISEYRALTSQSWSTPSNTARPTTKDEHAAVERRGSNETPHNRQGRKLSGERVSPQTPTGNNENLSRQDSQPADQRAQPDVLRSWSARKPSGEQKSRRPSADRVSLPPPAVEHERPVPPRVATPRSLLTSSGASQRATVRPASPKTSIASNAVQQAAAFERSLFRNSAILCDVQGTLLEYAKRNQDEADPRYDTDMVAVCKQARICVIRKRENREHGGTKLATSVWVLSDDGCVRCQQKLSEHAETVPYHSFFDPEKVSLAGSVEDELALRCHGANWSDPLDKEFRTSWVNYTFASTVEAAAFQSAVFGRALLSSLRTSKTTIIHEGIKGVFAIEEQFAKMDRLRLFEDDGVATPGAEGGVLALLHVSSTFGNGWAKFWLNSSRQHIYIKKDGERCVKLKGLNVSVPGSTPYSPGPSRRASMLDEHFARIDTARAPTKQINGLRVEFETFREREDFFALFKRVQERVLPLPYL